jgi:3-hydroxyacyl-CoA dehydrogenase
MGGLYAYESGQVIGACLIGSSVARTATLLGVLKVTFSKVMSAYKNHGRTVLAKRNSLNKSAHTERDCTMRRIVSKNYRSTATQMIPELCS